MASGAVEKEKKKWKDFSAALIDRRPVGQVFYFSADARPVGRLLINRRLVVIPQGLAHYGPSMEIVSV